MVFAPSTFLSESILPASLQLTAPLMLAGPLDEDPTVVAALDLTGRSIPLFSLSPAGQVFVLHLVRELVSRVRTLTSSMAKAKWCFSLLPQVCSGAGSGGPARACWQRKRPRMALRPAAQCPGGS